MVWNKDTYAKHIKPILTDYRTLLVVWLLIPLYTILKNCTQENNFLIFRQVYHHAMAGLSLYGEYPQQYMDMNHYGPLFMLIVAPFAIPPVWLGHLLWQVVLSLVLFFTIRKSDFSRGRQIFVYWFCANELLTAQLLSQFNVAIAAIILLAYICVKKEHDEWATLAIVIGTFVKLYGIVGLAFFPFSRHKKKFAATLFLWSIIAFVLPMAFTSCDYVLEQYHNWFYDLQSKNTANLFAIDENICLLGMVRKISGCATYSDLWLIIPGLLLFGAPYLRFSQYKYDGFKETILASVMMFVVLFSTGSESYGYIIALIGVVIWYTAYPGKRSNTDIFLMLFVFILSSLSPGDLFPRYLREEYVKPYALKALPVTLVWFKLCYEILTVNYGYKNYKNEESCNITTCI